MALKTGADYLDSLEQLRPTTYILGERVENPYEHPLIRPMVKGVARTYDMEHDSEGARYLVTRNESGERVSRFVKLYDNSDDLLAKVRMLRFISQRIGTCFMRCTGMDAINAVGSQVYDCDRKYGTDYWKRLLAFIDTLQAGDLTVFSGVTDVKGDRSLRPSQQADPDLYLHVVSKDSQGIVVRGAKIHQTGSLCAHWGIVVPAREMQPEDKDWAISFAIPIDEEGVIHVYGRGTLEARSLDRCDLGNAEYTKFANMVIFNNVFVPWERVFLFGEHEYAGPMVRNFGNFHRHSHGGCKSGVGDVIIGAAATAAEYNGVAKTSHVSHKLSEMLKVTEAIYGCSIAASVNSSSTPSGIQLVDPLLSNISKLYEGKELHEVLRMMIEIAGGIATDLPSDKDFANAEIGELLRKYLKGRQEVSTEDRVRISRLIEKLAFESRDIVSNIHGAGSPETHRMTVLRSIDIEALKSYAKDIAGIDKTPRPGVGSKHD